MRERERHHDEAELQLPSGGAGPLDSDLRAQAERLLAEGSAVIDRALSGDSAAFLAATRQEGGQ